MANDDAPGGSPAQRPGIVLQGRPAAPGLAIGPLVVVQRRESAVDHAAESPEAERRRLVAAVDAARQALAALATHGGGELAEEILMFQMALLDDPELLAPAQAALGRGHTAEAAWQTAIGELIDGYAQDEDEYFRARADDLRDLRQRVLEVLSGADLWEDVLPEHGLLVADTLTPSRFLEIDWDRAGGIALAGGSDTSHMAMLARARGVPLVTGLGESAARLRDGTTAILDADAGRLVVEPGPTTLASYRERLRAQAAVAAADARYRDAPAATADGIPVSILVNVDDPAVLTRIDPAICDGVGLTRTEFLFREGVPDEETQVRAYRQVVEWARGRPVTIRTLDAGGDKPVPGLTPAGESNPFLGLRGLRLSLARPEAFRVQLRALIRAAAHGPLKIMLPMVTLPRELERAREILSAVRDELAGEGHDTAPSPLGIMVETPAAALQPAAFAADFYSIGTNDLIQYVTAAARDIEAVAGLQDPTAAPVIELIGRVAEAGRARDVEVSVCGEMAARPDCVPALLDAGVRVLSVPPAAVGRVKRAVAAHRLAAGS